MKIPPVGTSFSLLNRLCEGREKFLGIGLGVDFVSLLLLDEALEAGLEIEESGHKVISVLCVAAWKVANEIIDVVLLGPACSIISGFGDATVDAEVSC